MALPTATAAPIAPTPISGFFLSVVCLYARTPLSKFSALFFVQKATCFASCSMAVISFLASFKLSLLVFTSSLIGFAEMIRAFFFMCARWLSKDVRCFFSSGNFVALSRFIFSTFFAYVCMPFVDACKKLLPFIAEDSTMFMLYAT